MAKIDLIIDIGSSYINIYKDGEGLILREPSMVVISKGKNIVAYGSEAKKLVLSTALPENCGVVCPIQEGSIRYLKMAVSMLDHFIARVVKRKEHFIKPKVRIFANIPCGSSADEKKIFEDVLYACGAKEVYLVESPIMALYGAYHKTPKSKYIVDIGGGITDVAYVQDGVMQFGKSYGIGGLNMDQGIIDCVENAYGVQISISRSEIVKLEIGTLFTNENTAISVDGKNPLSLMPKFVEIETDGIRGALTFFYGKIADIVLESFKSFSDETIAKIRQEGILVCGGGADIHGLKEFLEEKLKMPVQIPEKSALCAVLGGGRLLGDAETFNAILNIE